MEVAENQIQDASGTNQAPVEVNVEQQIMANLLAPDDVDIQPIEPVVENPEVVIPQAFRDQEADTNAPVVSYNPVWDYMQERAKLAGTDYEVPDFIKTRQKPDGTELTPQEEYDILLAEIARSSQPNIDDPLVLEYMEAKQRDGFDFKEFLNRKVSRESILEADDYTFMKHFMKERYGINDQRPNGMSDEQIEESVKKMDQSGILALQANQNRDTYRNMLEQADRAEADLRRSQENERMALIQANQQKLIDALFQRKAQLKDLYGMPVSEAQKREFQEAFKNLMAIDPQTGVPKLHKYFSNDDILYDAVFLMYLRENGMRDYITQMKEDVKKNYIERLDIAPKDNMQRTPVTPQNVDVSQLMMPE